MDASPSSADAQSAADQVLHAANVVDSHEPLLLGARVLSITGRVYLKNQVARAVRPFHARHLPQAGSREALDHDPSEHLRPEDNGSTIRQRIDGFLGKSPKPDGGGDQAN